MASVRLTVGSARALRCLPTCTRPLSTTIARHNQFDALNKRAQDTAETYRKFQKSRPLNPHFTNTNSTIANEMPSVGQDAPPPELISNSDGNFTPKDSVPENTQRMTGSTQSSQGEDVSGANKDLKGDVDGKGELGVGEMKGASFKVEPMRRTGEDDATLKARLLYQSRKRGTLESELLMSTFADAHLATMTPAQLRQYDELLLENDWDLYYWVTQKPTPTSHETAEGGSAGMATEAAKGKEKEPDSEKDEQKREPASGEWAQTVGTVKAAYRPVPTRWKNSEILKLLREHVESRSAGSEKEGKGLGMMPEVTQFS